MCGERPGVTRQMSTQRHNPLFCTHNTVLDHSLTGLHLDISSVNITNCAAWWTSTKFLEAKRKYFSHSFHTLHIASQCCRPPPPSPVVSTNRLLGCHHVKAGTRAASVHSSFQLLLSWTDDRIVHDDSLCIDYLAHLGGGRVRVQHPNPRP